MGPRTSPLPGLAAAVAVLALLGGCSADAPEPSPSSSSAPASTATPSPLTPSAREPAVPEPARVSLPALRDRTYDGGGLRVGRTLAVTEAYTRSHVSYRSDGLRISGILNVPRGKGPFPVLVLNHGYIDPDVYVSGQGLAREQDYLAREGYVVLHTDYRNHAGSDDDPRAEIEMRLGYTVDVINAVHAVRRSKLPFLDGSRVGLLGRSMGGGVTYNALVARPGMVRAAVVYAPVSSDTADNFNRWIRDEPGRSRLSDRILRRYGTPRESARFWRQVSPRTYFSQVTEPVLIHHGTADESCPIAWSRETLRALRRAGADARMLTYPGEPHAFVADWELSMRRTVRFLDRHVAS